MPCDRFQFKIIYEIMDQLDVWWDSLDRGSARHKASTYTGQHNTETQGQTCMSLGDSNPQSQYPSDQIDFNTY
jgi:hypothetical protein